MLGHCGRRAGWNVPSEHDLRLCGGFSTEATRGAQQGSHERTPSRIDIFTGAKKLRFCGGTVERNLNGGWPILRWFRADSC